ncbi:MAG TPA: hypothetical protein VG368_05340 [Acidimicrobiales bacterium]|jgi:hypothetical protein|nr:hypothetical protein [Acidimicrobiales bacterium]
MASRPSLSADKSSRTRSSPSEASGQALTNLRGAGVSIDARRLGRFLIGLTLVGMAAGAALFFVAGIHKNDQIERLYRDGRPVSVTVTACLGNLAGSGTNAAGYSCRGTYTVAGRIYTENIPENSFYASGTKLQAVAVRGDPGLMTTIRALDSEHASWTVFEPSIVLVVLFALTVGGVAAATRRNRHARDTPPQP